SPGLLRDDDRAAALRRNPGRRRVEVGMTRRSGDGARALQLAGLAAAIVLAGVVNVLAARHFTRWDWTAHKRWSISPATLETLNALDRPAEVWTVAGPGSACAGSIPIATPFNSSTCSVASGSRRGAPRTAGSRPTRSWSWRAATGTGF